MSKFKNSNNQIQKAIEDIAKERGTTPNDIRKNIQIAIDMAWKSKDKKEKETQNKLFPNGKPSIENFLRVLENKIRKC